MQPNQTTEEERRPVSIVDATNNSKTDPLNSTVKARIDSLQFGNAQTYKNITILPLIAPSEGTFHYRTLGEALATWDIAISEASAAGSVPELMAVNRGGCPVLLIDGEELAGAKQNRVLNTSILIKEVSETRIPVSGTEHGRWSYASRGFTESGHVMPYRSRSRKTRSVHQSLESCGAPISNQCEIWDDLAALQARAGASSPTSALDDLYKSREADLRQSDRVFQPVANQVGLLAFIGGKPVGAELLSLMSAYAKLHSKLVRSYTLEALVAPEPSAGGLVASEPRKDGPVAPKPGEDGPDSALRIPHSALAPHSQLAQAFLTEITRAQERQFPSVGHGTDYRYRFVAPKPSEGGLVAPKPGEGGSPVSASQLSAFQPFSLCGSALVHEDEVIHAAFFRLEETQPPNPTASFSNRRPRLTH
jgi:hypothetical protein